MLGIVWFFIFFLTYFTFLVNMCVFVWESCFVAIITHSNAIEQWKLMTSKKSTLIRWIKRFFEIFSHFFSLINLVQTNYIFCGMPSVGLHAIEYLSIYIQSSAFFTCKFSQNTLDTLQFHLFMFGCFHFKKPRKKQ